ncbi:MAG: AsnC family transcriptional regulator [Candidatus Hadarchaeum yellowstonense]|uniref:AsnC family transcriptional regulator n=1 Tax=Hadarchaeum yellowstonense TaxID=1776334 RepID=A0A147JX34_HADYE|nr:MAG: AsnC family transcriptional regulator [Candidatus Hadarchaeum yellowstonense]
MVQAYILVTAAIGKVKQVAKEIKKIPDVKNVHVVTGPYDIIVHVDTTSMDTLSKAVVEGIHKIKGVVDTNTAIVIDI